MKRRDKILLCVVCFFATIMLMGAITLSGTEKNYGRVMASDLDVNGATTEYSPILNIHNVRSMGIWIRATSAGAPDVSVYAEFSPTQASANFKEIEGGSKVIDLTDTNPHVDFLIKADQNYMRLKFVGNAGNPADTFIDCVVNRTYGYDATR
jgi:hypothetical protein